MSSKQQEFYEYVTAQIEKINETLMRQRKDILRMDDISIAVSKQQRKCEELDMKIKLIEVYHSQNFNNNERLFNYCNKFDFFEARIGLLQQMQANQSKYRQIRQLSTQQQTAAMVSTLNHTPSKGPQHIKQRYQQGIQFKVQEYPRLPNTESTKDISIESQTQRYIKKIQAEIYKFVEDRLVLFQREFLQKNNPITGQDKQYEEWFSFSQSMISKKSSKVPKEQLPVKGTNFKKKIDAYYVDQLKKSKSEVLLQNNQQFKKKIRNKKNQQSDKYKSKSSSSQKQRMAFDKSKAKQKAKLGVVGQYFNIGD